MADGVWAQMPHPQEESVDDERGVAQLLAALAAVDGNPALAGEAAADQDSDEEVALLLQAGLAVSRERYQRRGRLLTSHMRQVKAAKAAVQVSLAPHVAGRIQQANERMPLVLRT